MDPSSSSRSRRTKSTIATTKSTAPTSRRSSAYDKDFEQHLIEHRIYPKGYEYPNNRPTPKPPLDDLRQRLAQPRPSLSPSQFTTSQFETFEQANDRVIDENEVMRNVLPTICGNSKILSKQNLLFTEFESIADNIIVDAKPDLYDGARLTDVNKQVQADLGSFVIPTAHPSAPVAPNFFLEAKAPRGGADVAKRQACHDGALGARAMHQLQSYKQGPVYDGNAYTVTSTYHAGTGILQMYTTHPTQAEDRQNSTEYHMTKVKGWELTSDVDTFRPGASALRNARDWAQEQRDGIISAANDRARSMNERMSPPERYSHNDVSDPRRRSSTAYSQHVQGFDSSTAPAGPGTVYTDSSPFEPSDYTYRSETTDPYAPEESETSLDELALDELPGRSASNKRRNRPSERSVSKAPRYADDASRQSRRSRR